MQYDNILHGNIVLPLITFEYIWPVCDASNLALYSWAHEFFRQGEVHMGSQEIISLFVGLNKITAIVCKNLICQSSFLRVLNYVYIYRLEPPACSMFVYNRISYVPLNGSGLFLYTLFATFKYLYSAQLLSIKTFFPLPWKAANKTFGVLSTQNSSAFTQEMRTL